MKIHHFAIIFVILALAAISVCESRIALTDAQKRNTDRYDIAFDRACDTAAEVLRGRGEELSDSLIRDAAARFNNSLCTYFGVSAFSQEGRMLLQKVPVIAITCTDGIYIGYCDNENGQIVRKWTDKISYSQIDQEKIFEDFFPASDISGNSDGRALRIELPEGDLGMFQRNVRDIGFTAFYLSHGYMDQGGSYTYASSVSKIPDHYYINISGTGYSSPLYYHIDSCRFKSEECIEMNSREECAEYGAFCCPECRNVLF